MNKVSFTYIDPSAFSDSKSINDERKRLKGFQNSQARTNQNFKFDNNQLNINEVAFLIDQTFERLNNPATSKEDRTAGIAVLVSLITGQSVQKVSRLLLIKRLSNKSQREGFFLTKKGVYLRLYIAGSGIKGAELSKTSPAHMISYFIHLKIPDFLDELLRNHLVYVHKSKSPTLFNLKSETLRDICDEFLVGIRDTRHKKLTLKRIAEYLRYHLSRHPFSDEATMILILGTPDSYRVPSSIFYTSLDSIRLAKIYIDVCEKLEIELGFKQNYSLFPDDLNLKSHAESETLLGTPYRLKRRALQKLIEDLKKEIKALKRQKTWDLADYIHFHNVFALYSYLFFIFVTALRKVKKPKFDSKHIDKKTGLAGLEDKRKSHKDNTRRVWLPPELLLQIERYYLHVQVVYDRLSLICTDLLTLYQNVEDTMSIGYLFWIDEDTKTLKFFHSGLIKPILKDKYDYDMPMHSNRHYLRSMLLESCCPRQAIDSLLGHHSRGLEPSSNVSTLFQYDVIKAYEKHLHPILIKDGWEALQGLEWSDI